MIRVAIVDDDALIRESLSILLEGREGITIVGTGVNGLDALRLCHDCDVLLLDLRMPVKSGLDVLAQVAAHTRVLVLTTFDEDSEMLQSLRQGAHGKRAVPVHVIAKHHCLIHILSAFQVSCRYHTIYPCPVNA